MTVADLLVEALDKLGDKDFKTFKWHLSNNDFEDFTQIPGHHLANKDREDTVTKLQTFGDETAVTVTVKVLKKMNQRAAALALEKAYTESEERKASSSTTRSSSAAAAAPSAILADNGGLVFAPVVSNTKGTWNVTINKN